MDRKVRNQKKKNTETGLLMGQNTNIFSQLSATYLQSKSHVSEEEENFVSVTQIVEYHDPKINRLISMLRKKAEVTKAKAASELREEVLGMDSGTLETFMPTFAQLYMEVFLNEQSKQVYDQFTTMISHLLARHKKVVIKEIDTLYGPLLVMNRGGNIPLLKTYAQLFTGSDEQLHEKGVILLLKKEVTKKFVVLSRVILECEEGNKVGQNNFQRNCSSLLKTVKDLIRSYDSLTVKKEEISVGFVRLVKEIEQICEGKHVQEFMKAGGKGKAALLEFYQCLMQGAAKHPEWGIEWEKYGKIVCQNFLDKDPMVQQTLWRSCNRQCIESCLAIEAQSEEHKERYAIFTRLLPKSDQKLLSCLKLGGASLYKELPHYLTLFPFTHFSPDESHKSYINKIAFMRKLMAAILEQEDENEARLECYYHLCCLFLPGLGQVQSSVGQLEEKKQQEVKGAAGKATRELMNSLQESYYKSPPVSRNSFTYNLPTLFCKILWEFEPQFDFKFDLEHTFPLYSAFHKDSDYCRKVYDTIFEHCAQQPLLQLLYLENFPTREVQIDMGETDHLPETLSKIFLLSQQASSPHNWFNPDWDTKKQIIVFDPRITLQDLNAAEEKQLSATFCFSPSHRRILNRLYHNPVHDSIRIEFFLNCLQNQTELVPFLISYMKEQLMARERNLCVGRLLEMFMESLEKLEKKTWVVGAHEVLRMRVITDIVVESLTLQKDLDVNKSHLSQFLNNICLFALTMYNYKLDADAEELLKLASKIVYLDHTKEGILISARTAIQNAYHTFVRVGGKDSSEKQRKNRLSRLLNFIDKILWFAVEKKNRQAYTGIMTDLLQSEGWSNADSRPDLWLIGESLLNAMGGPSRKAMTEQLVAEHRKFNQFLCLILCCQMLLPLQRHPQAQSTFTEWQIEILNHISEHCCEESQLDMLSAVIEEASSSSLHILAFGAQILLKSFMKNYQSLSKEALASYCRIALQGPVKHLMDSEGEAFMKRSLLVMSLCSELPLPDLEEVAQIFKALQEKALESSGVKKIGYLAIQSRGWEAGMGLEALNQERVQQIMDNLMGTLSDMDESNRNFITFAAFEVLNALYPIRTAEVWKAHWPAIEKQLIWAPSERGSPLHRALQSGRFRFMSRVFAEADQAFKEKVAVLIPEEMNEELESYREILDQIEEDLDEGTIPHHENIVSMFIECAEVLMRIAGGLDAKVQPREEMVLALLQCPFPGIKKTAFILLKQMYELKLVQRVPPPSFLTYLSLEPWVLECNLDASLSNVMISYFYSWQAMLQRRTAIQGQDSEEEENLTLEDYLQEHSLHEEFLKTMFEILEKHLDYGRNQSEYEISPEQLVGLDSLPEESNCAQKVFRNCSRTLFLFILNFPLFLRDFMNINKKYKNTCDRLLRGLISEAIFKEEVNRIELREHEWKTEGNFDIYVTPNCKQIYAEYTHDVIRIGLRLVMRSNYPLSPISIEFGEGLKIDEGSRWALMLQSQLHNRNNTIINGILLWKENIDKKLAGVEECAICFDIVSPTGQLPKKACKTCKKRFHSNCIMRWFTKSNKSECPLCKSQFL